MNGRLLKIVFVCAVCLYTLLVLFNNISDYHSNFEFVHMVARMEDTFSKERNGWRAIDNTLIHHLFFLLIITWEFSIAVLLYSGAVRMIRKFKLTAIEFKKAKAPASLGL